MKKLYFRWKDEACNGVNPEWVEMTGKEFLEFKRRPENKHRKFIEHIDEYQETSTIVIETTQEKYRQWHSEDVSRKRKRDENRKLGYIELSMDEEINSIHAEEMTLHDVIADDSVDIAKEVLKHCEINRLKEVLKMLSTEEMELINALYLSKTSLTVRAYAEQLGMSHVAVLKRKKAVFEKIKKLF